MEIGRSELRELAAAGLEVRDELGRGTSGVVFEGYQEILDRRVALKRVPVDAANPKAIARLDREVAALSALEHPGVVKLMDVRRMRSALWFVLEYVDGRTLRWVTATKRAGWSPPDALAVISRLSATMQYVSERRIVHRDLKPANVFVTTSGRIKICDFGIALVPRVASPSHADSRLTVPGTVLGTPAYLAPEQIDGDKEPTSAADIYSLGMIAYELLLGQLPFSGREGVLSILLAQQHEDPPRPRDLNPELSPALETALLAPLEKDPIGRPGPREFWDVLAAAADDLWPGWEADADLSLEAGSWNAVEVSESGAGDETVERIATPTRAPRVQAPVTGSRTSSGARRDVATRSRRGWVVPAAAFAVTLVVVFLIVALVAR